MLTGKKKVLPSSDDNVIQNDMDNLLDEKDVKIEVMRARGAGGQVTELITHLSLDEYSRINLFYYPARK